MPHEMRRLVPILLAFALPVLASCSQAPTRAAAAAQEVSATGVTGRLLRHEAFASREVAPRNIDVWLPPGYDRDPARRYPVLYMHDGQNLFDPASSYGGVDWDVDETMTRLIDGDHVREAIVVGIWNTPARFGEYMPQKAVVGPTVATGIDAFPPVAIGDMRADAYMGFLVEELKPFIDDRYRTLPGRDDTLAMGSSMGGLVSLYAIAEYPRVFGGVGAISTHWPAGDGAMVDWFAAHLPDPRTHRLYFDHGTATLDAAYAPYQLRMDAALRKAGYEQGRNWTTRRFEDAAHDERAWRARVECPLRFLLGK